MGLVAKLNLAFLVVILVMAIGHAGYALFVDWQASHAQSEKRLQAVINRLQDKEFPQVFQSVSDAAEIIAHDPAVLKAWSDRNRDDLSKAIKSSTDKLAMAGFVTIIDDKGKVFYSSDSPAKFGYSIGNKCSGVDAVLIKGQPWHGPARFSPTGDATITAMTALKSASAQAGIVAVSQPLNSEYLTGLVTKFKFLPEQMQGVDMALYSAAEHRVIAITPDLAGNNGGLIAKVNQQGDKALPAKNGEVAGRLWQAIVLNDPPNNIGELLLATPVPDLLPRLQNYLGEIAATTLIAAILALILSTAVNGSIKRPLRFLIQRARDLAAQKQSLAALEGLRDEWLELGELMDTAVTSMRSTIQSLKAQLSEQSSGLSERNKQADISYEQLDNLNRQLSDKTRQCSELSKQINFANQQAVLLQQKLESVLQISNEGFLVLDQFGSVLSANPVFLNWLGAKEIEIAGSFCFDLVRRPGEPRDDLHSQTVARPGGNPADLINQFYPEGVIHHRYQDKSITVLAHLQPVVSDDSNIQGWIMVLHDKSLRSEVAQLRNEIVTMLSESIRGPLVSIEPTWKSILSNAAQTMHPSVGQALAQVHSHYEQTTGLVESLLMMYGGAVPSSATPHEPVQITKLVAECLEEVAGKARERQLSLDYKTMTGLPNVSSDRETMKGALLQLLEKMIGIAAPGGRVRVESTVKGSEVRLGITSSGPALAQQEIDEMFAGFIEGKHEESTYSSRLSMYLARNNVERLGGRIWAESDAGRGTSIYFTLPVY